jgi:hypothetical protein
MPKPTKKPIAVGSSYDFVAALPRSASGVGEGAAACSAALP